MAKTKRRKRYPKENIVKILLLIIVVWLLAMLSMNQIVSSLVKTEEVQTTVLEHTDSGYGLISGNEYTISAPADGAAERTVAEGMRVRKGNAVFNVNGVIAYTNASGRVSYQIDGLEGNTDLSAVCSTNLETRYAEQQGKDQETTGSDAVAGAVYAKVIDIFDDIYLYLTVPRTSYTNTLEIDTSIPVRLVDIDYEILATIQEIVDAADGSRYLKLKVENVKETVFQQRIYKIELPYDRVTALSIPEEALVERQGETGVYYLQKGFVFWKPVTPGQAWPDLGLVAIEQTEEDEDGLQSGDIVVTTPHLVREGENIKF